MKNAANADCRGEKRTVQFISYQVLLFFKKIKINRCITRFLFSFGMSYREMTRLGFPRTRQESPHPETGARSPGSSREDASTSHG